MSASYGLVPQVRARCVLVESVGALGSGALKLARHVRVE
jgi:hypothetical protein